MPDGRYLISSKSLYLSALLQYVRYLIERSRLAYELLTYSGTQNYFHSYFSF
jgi:hypothetical protein